MGLFHLYFSPEPQRAPEFYCIALSSVTLPESDHNGPGIILSLGDEKLPASESAGYSTYTLDATLLQLHGKIASLCLFKVQWPRSLSTAFVPLSFPSVPGKIAVVWQPTHS